MAVQKFITINKASDRVAIATVGCDSCDTCNETEYEISSVQLAKWLIDFASLISVQNDTDMWLTLKLRGTFTR